VTLKRGSEVVLERADVLCQTLVPKLGNCGTLSLFDLLNRSLDRLTDDGLRFGRHGCRRIIAKCVTKDTNHEVGDVSKAVTLCVLDGSGDNRLGHRESPREIT